MKAILRCLLATAIVVMPIESFSLVRPFTASDCASLGMPKTVLLVHASWCSHCKAFMPTYIKVSDQEKYNDWTFYAIENNNFDKVCGTAINGVPVTFKNNMQSNLTGNRSQSVLEDFLDNHHLQQK